MVYMPTLPTLTVTDAQAARMLAAFGDAAAYKVWLKNQIIEHVIFVEGETKNAELEAQRRAWQDSVRANLSQ